MSDGLPEGWALATLDEIAEFNPRHPSALDSGLQVTFAPMSAVSETNWVLRPTNERPLGDVRKGYVHFADGDVLFAKITPCMENGKAAVATALRNGLGCGTTELHVLRPRGGIESRLIYHFTHQPWFRQAAARSFTGTAGQLRVPLPFLREAELPLAPLPEQRRIVAKLEELLGKVDACKKRLAKIPVLLKRFRQAVLAASCSGRLTEDWREAYTEVTLAPPPRPQRGAASRKSRRGANLSFDGELFLDGMPELPTSWTYRRADEVVAHGSVVTYGIVLPGPEIEGGVPYVRQQDVLEGTIRLDELRHTTVEIAARHDRSALRSGDVLLCIIRNLRVAVVPPGLDGANITQGAVRLRPAAFIRPEYLAAYLSSPIAQRWMTKRYFGMDMPRINVEDARAVPIAVPPLPEQDEILRHHAALLAVADAVEGRVEAARIRANALAQAILAKAFSGELVFTEAELARREGRSFESAAVMLERIRSERGRAGEGDAARRRRHPSRRSVAVARARRARG